MQELADVARHVAPRVRAGALVRRAHEAVEIGFEYVFFEFGAVADFLPGLVALQSARVGADFLQLFVGGCAGCFTAFAFLLLLNFLVVVVPGLTGLELQIGEGFRGKYCRRAADAARCIG